MEACLRDICERMFLNKFKLNDNKTEVLHFSSTHVDTRSQFSGITVEDTYIACKDSECHLGNPPHRLLITCISFIYGLSVVHWTLMQVSWQSSMWEAGARLCNVKNRLFGLHKKQHDPLQCLQNTAASSQKMSEIWQHKKCVFFPPLVAHRRETWVQDTCSSHDYQSSALHVTTIYFWNH